MQNHDSPEFDAEFMDDSWEKMRQQLDVELPQERKRRGGLLWWWTGVAAGIMIGIASMWWLMPKEGTNLGNFPIQQGESLEKTTTTKIANAPNTEEIKTTNNEVSLTSKKAEVTQIESTKQLEQYERLSSNPARKSSKAIPKNNTTVLNKQELQVADNQIIKSKINASATLGQSQVMVENELTTNAISTLDEANAPRENFSNFPFLPIRTLESLNVSAPDVALPIFPIRQRNRLRFGAQTAMSTNQEFAQLGYAVGVGAEWQFKPRWSVDAALQYANRPLVDLNVVVNSEAVLVEEVIDEEEPEDTSIETESTNIGEVVTTSTDTTYVVAATNNRFDFLELPLALQFHLHPRWSVGVGGRIAYRLPELSFSQAEDAIALDGQGGFSNQQNGEVFDPNQYTYVNSSYSLPDLARWRLSPTVAVQYRISPNWQIRGQYSQTQWLTSSNASSFVEQMDARGAAENLIHLPRRTHEFQLLLRYRF